MPFAELRIQRARIKSIAEEIDQLPTERLIQRVCEKAQAGLLCDLRWAMVGRGRRSRIRSAGRTCRWRTTIRSIGQSVRRAHDACFICRHKRRDGTCIERKREFPADQVGAAGTRHGINRCLPSEKNGAGTGNRTLVFSLEGCCSTIELHPRTPEIPQRTAEVNPLCAERCGDPVPHRYSAGTGRVCISRLAWATSGGRKRFSRKALITTLTLDSAMANPANIGDIRMPKEG